MLVAIGWIVVHQLNICRDRQNKQADFRLQFLLEAYRRLEFSAHRDIVGSEEFMRKQNLLLQIFNYWVIQNKYLLFWNMQIIMPVIRMEILVMYWNYYVKNYEKN